MKTHCKRGHPRTPENLRGLSCRICEQEKNHLRWLAKREVLGGLPRAERTALRRAARKTHCSAGHPLDPAKHGCKICQVEKDRLRRAQKPNPPKLPKPTRTHCKNGHPENRNNQGDCRACKREACKRKEARKRALKALLPKFCKRGHPKPDKGFCKECHDLNDVAKRHRRRARKTGAGGSYTLQEEKALRTFYEDRCVCCWRTKEELRLLGLRLVLDHVVAVAKGGTSFISNMQPLCHHKSKGTAGCNEYKGDFHDTDYRLEGLAGLA